MIRFDCRRAPLLLTLSIAVTAACGGAEKATSSEAQGKYASHFLVQVSRPEHGTIATSDGRIRCGTAPSATTCTASYGWNEIATLTAVPDDGMTFGTWAGDCQYRGPCVLDTRKNGADKTVLAVFGPDGVVSHGNFTTPGAHGREYFDFVAAAPQALRCSAAGCHGVTLAGAGIAPSCESCHARAGWTGWRTNCSFCHGVKSPASQAGYAFATSPALAAPGDAISARLTGAPAPDRAGAHQAHLTGRTAGGLSFAAPFPCATCHAVPSDLSHISGAAGRATVSVAGEGSLPATAASYDPATGRCSTRCHGSTPSPAWSATGLQCGACHGLPPASPHPAVSTGLPACALCHPATVDPTGAILLAGGKHVNGSLEVLAGSGSCTGCHRSLGTTGTTAVSKHDPPFDGSSSPSEDSLCSACHDTHDSGRPMSDDARCISCHAGQGQLLGESTPPLLVGWTDPVGGDFHGERASTGLGGGTLEPGYTRGQPALPCKTCHAGHTSTNPFLLAPRVNGATIPPNAISRSGVGAQVLCEACHLGDRHSYCNGCHGGDPAPAGSACFTCHGHEGLVSFEIPGRYHEGDPDGTFGCDHCHGGAYGPVRGACSSTAPTFSPPGSSVDLVNLAARSVTIYWGSATNTTSYVEWGTDGADRFVAGSRAMGTSHSVPLTGLAPSTTYTFRVRMVDGCRNVTESPGTFTTRAASYVGVPTGLALYYPGNYRAYAETYVQGFWWAAVPDAVSYELQIAGDATFASLSVAPVVTPVGTGSADAVRVELPTSGGGSCAYKQYYWRVRARNADGYWSGWSTTVNFGASDCS